MIVEYVYGTKDDLHSTAQGVSSNNHLWVTSHIGQALPMLAWCEWWALELLCYLKSWQLRKPLLIGQDVAIFPLPLKWDL